jgi:hypothetical protein
MVETDRLDAGKLGAFHLQCANEWRRYLGKTRPEILGKAPHIPLPRQRALGRAGRLPAPPELKEHFRWLILHRLGRLSLRSVAAMLSEEYGTKLSRPTIQYGVASIERLLPPLELASAKFRPYLVALQAAGVPLPPP